MQFHVFWKFKNFKYFEMRKFETFYTLKIWKF